MLCFIVVCRSEASRRRSDEFFARFRVEKVESEDTTRRTFPHNLPAMMIENLHWKDHSVIAFVTAIVILILSRSKRRGTTKWPIAPGALPIIGHALSLLDSDKFYKVLLEWKNKVGENGIFEFSLFNRRWIVVWREDIVMEAMRLRPIKLRRASMLEPSIDSVGFGGVFSAEGQRWKHERRIVAPALNHKNVKDYFEAIKLVAKRLVKKWGKKQHTDDVNATSDVSSCSLDVIGLTMLGMDLDSLNNPDSIFSKDAYAVLNVIFRRTLSPIPYWRIPLIGQDIDGGRYCSDRVMQTLQSLISEKRKVLRNTKSDSQEQEKRKTFLEKVLEMTTDGEKSKQLEDDRMIGNLANLIIGGTDTTSNTLSFCLWELSQDESGIQDEIYQEIKAMDKTLDDMVLDDFTENFPLLCSFLYEILRTKGPTPYLFFEPSQALKFQGETILPGTIICALTNFPGEKAGSEVPVGPNGEGPDQFSARRWLVPIENAVQSDDIPVKVKRPSNNFGGYMVFGHGHRSCPGQHLAEVEILTFLVYILQNFELQLKEHHPPLQIISRFTEAFDGDLMLSLKPRPTN